MTEREVRHEYLNIANDRRTRRGELTIDKKRAVKGRKGIGKFAGLVAADVMEVCTQCRGESTRLRIVKEELLRAQRDLEKVDLPVEAGPCDARDHGTTVTLSCLNTKFLLPQPGTLRKLLALEYGRERDFVLLVNGEQLAHEDIPGQKFSATVHLPNAGTVTINFTIMDKPAQRSQTGVVMRVGGKVVGQPTFLGLDENHELPPRLLRHVVGEVVADSLEEDVTADWAQSSRTALHMMKLVNGFAIRLRIRFGRNSRRTLRNRSSAGVGRSSSASPKCRNTDGRLLEHNSSGSCKGSMVSQRNESTLSSI